MESYVLTHKREGETPLQVLESVRTQRPDLREVSITYAGRLDPLASGVLVLLIGDECVRKEQYTALDKWYTTTVLWGVESDTLDPLGLVRLSSGHDDQRAMMNALIGLEGQHILPYPLYSSRTVDGRPLWSYALKGETPPEGVPKRIMNVESVEVVRSYHMSTQELLVDMEKRLEGVLRSTHEDERVASFRIKEVLHAWRTLPERQFPMTDVRFKVSSGTYIRSLVAYAGEVADCGALAYRIRRDAFVGLC